MSPTSHDPSQETQQDTQQDTQPAPSRSWRGLTVAFTGGGSAGHVTPNLALIESLRAQGGEAVYFGRGDEERDGVYQPSVEKALAADVPNLPYYEVPSERLRRYFDLRNFTMPFTVLKGIWRAYTHMRSLKPDLLVSKGGFVALPVVFAAWLNRVPVLLHESDGSLGLAHRLSLPFAKVVCVAQARARAHVKHPYVAHTGAPVRRAFLEADPEAARERFGLSGERPLLVIFGGSLGAAHLNSVTRDALGELLTRYEVFHVCGPGKSDPQAEALHQAQGYHQVEYVKEGFADLLHAAHLVVGRAGANTIAELVLLQRPALLVPLPTQSSRGDQLLNARDYEALGCGRLLRDEELSVSALLGSLKALEAHYQAHVEAARRAPSADGTQTTLAVMRQLTLTRRT